MTTRCLQSEIEFYNYLNGLDSDAKLEFLKGVCHAYNMKCRVAFSQQAADKRWYEKNKENKREYAKKRYHEKKAEALLNAHALAEYRSRDSQLNDNQLTTNQLTTN